MSRQLEYLGKGHPFSHFYSSPFSLLGTLFYEVEQPYQMTKAHMLQKEKLIHDIFCESEPCKQKFISKKIPKSQLWEKIKVQVMIRLDFEKFSQNPKLLHYLISTGEQYLLENNIRDPFWGIPQNHAGKILMKLRSHFVGEQKLPDTIIIGDSFLRDVNGNNIKLNSQIISLSGVRLGYLFQAVKFITGTFVKYVVVLGGMNDLSTDENRARMGPKQLAKVVAEFEKVFTELSPRAVLIICSVLTRPGGEGRVHTHIKRYNQLLVNMKNNFSSQKVRVLEFQDLTAEHFSDGLHVSDKGTIYLENKIKEALNDCVEQ